MSIFTVIKAYNFKIIIQTIQFNTYETTVCDVIDDLLDNY